MVSAAFLLPAGGNGGQKKMENRVNAAGQDVKDQSNNFPDHAHTQPSSVPGFASFEAANLALVPVLNESQAVLAELQETAERTVSAYPIEAYPLMSEARRYCLNRCVSRTMILDAGLEDRLHKAQRAQSDWFQRFESMNGAELDFFSYYNLYVRSFLSNFDLATCRYLRNEDFDRWHSSFIQVLDLAERVFTGDSSSFNKTADMNTQIALKGLRYGSLPVSQSTDMSRDWMAVDSTHRCCLPSLPKPPIVACV